MKKISHILIFIITVGIFVMSGISSAHASTVTITGSNFTPTGNSVQMTNQADPTQVYEITNIPSADSRTLTFVVSTTTLSVANFPPTGVYLLRTGAFNSAWSPSITVNILNMTPPALPPAFSIAPIQLLPPIGPSSGSYPVGTPISFRITMQNLGVATTAPVTISDNSGVLATTSVSFTPGQVQTLPPYSLILSSDEAPSDTFTFTVGNVSTTTVVSPITLLSPSPLSVSCSDSATSTTVGSSVTFTATSTGGTAGQYGNMLSSIYTFTWSGSGGTPQYLYDNPLPLAIATTSISMASTSSFSQTYSTTGLQPPVTVNVTTTGGQQISQSCGNVIVNPGTTSTTSASSAPSNPHGFSVTLGIPSGPIYSGVSATLTSSISGGTAPFTYVWNLGNNQSYLTHSLTYISANYHAIGTYTVTLTVTDATGLITTSSQVITVTQQPYTPSSGSVNATKNGDDTQNGNKVNDPGQSGDEQSYNFLSSMTANIWNGLTHLLGL